MRDYINNQNIERKLKNLKIDERLGGIFIILGFFTILGDEFVKKYYIFKDKEAYKYAKILFITSLTGSFFIYLYFLRQNKKTYYERLIKNQETMPNLIRLAGSFLVVVGVGCLIIYQLTERELTDGIPV